MTLREMVLEDIRKLKERLKTADADEIEDIEKMIEELERML